MFLICSYSDPFLINNLAKVEKVHDFILSMSGLCAKSTFYCTKTRIYNTRYNIITPAKQK